MSALDEVKAALLAEGTPYREVEGAAGLAAAMKAGPKSVPMAFVFFGDEVSGTNERDTGKVLQRMERNLSVVSVIDSGHDPAGEADMLETVKQWPRDQLIGMTISGDDAKEPITHVQGGVAEFLHGRVWYEDVFSLPTYISEKS